MVKFWFWFACVWRNLYHYTLACTPPVLMNPNLIHPVMIQAIMIGLTLMHYSMVVCMITNYLLLFVQLRGRHRPLAIA